MNQFSQNQLSNLIRNLSIENEAIANFMNQLLNLFPHERLSINTRPNQSNLQCTTGESKSILGRLQVINKQEIQTIVSLANEFEIPLYPISTGKNWGYGTSLPVKENSFIIDLSLMNKILEVDLNMKWVRLEPGVTQKQLRDYFDQHNIPFMVPTTGAGPFASIIGNALERGYGITPHQNHFEALLSIEAVLTNGQIYNSPMLDLGGEELKNNFKYGIGPFLDGIFAQSNFGIVSEATVSMAMNPEAMELFVFELESVAQLPEAVKAIRTITQKYSSFISGINLMNQRRVISMKGPYPHELLQSGERVLDDEVIRKLGKGIGIPAWMGVGAIYGYPELIKVIKKDIKKILSFSKLRFLNSKHIPILEKVSRYIPAFLKGDEIRNMIKGVCDLNDVLLGRPSEVAFPLVYWKSKKQFEQNSSYKLHEDKDCGLIWYAPLVVMNEEKIRSYIEFVDRICKKNGIEPLITFTSISDRCFDSTVPILFDKKNQEERAAAQSCYEELILEGQKLGFFPYRVGVSTMSLLTQMSDSWELSSQIKKALDPKNILSPGRYSK